MVSIKKGLKHLFSNPRDFTGVLVKKYFNWLPDKQYLSLLHFITFGKFINWNSPLTFNEKLNWLKIYDYSNDQVKLVDKNSVKDYVKEKIGEQYIIKTLAIYERFEDIVWESLPDQFVIKTTHGGGGQGVVICKDKSAFDRDRAAGIISDSMKCDTDKLFREKPYRDVHRKIIVEEYISSSDGELKDYKFFCFNGEVRCFKIDFGRFVEHHANYYDADCNLLPFGETCCRPDYSHNCEIPENIQTMISLAERLSAGQKFLRVDMYNAGGKIYFGELTFFPAGGMGPFTDNAWDIKLGSWIELGNK